MDRLALDQVSSCLEEPCRNETMHLLKQDDHAQRGGHQEESEPAWTAAPSREEALLPFWFQGVFQGLALIGPRPIRPSWHHRQLRHRAGSWWQVLQCRQQAHNGVNACL